jgi:hypothetical protein
MRQAVRDRPIERRPVGTGLAAGADFGDRHRLGYRQNSMGTFHELYP